VVPAEPVLLAEPVPPVVEELEPLEPPIEPEPDPDRLLLAIPLPVVPVPALPMPLVPLVPPEEPAVDPVTVPEVLLVCID
jgi:hypothetical protein